MLLRTIKYLEWFASELGRLRSIQPFVWDLPRVHIADHRAQIFSSKKNVVYVCTSGNNKTLRKLNRIESELQYMSNVQ